MPTVHLIDRALVAVSGADAEHFLQNILTTDLDALTAGEAKPGALLTPQGKILFDFLISRADGGFRLECRADIADDFVRRLMLYKLRAKVEIGKESQSVVAVSWEDDSAIDGGRTGAMAVRDARFPEDITVVRLYGAGIPAADADILAWHALRIRNGVPESGSDYALGDAFPHDVLLDQMGGVGFRKGCYVGQEVVSRMQHRGTARRRVLIANAESNLPPSATTITAGGRPMGTLGSVSGRDGLALVRIDRVAEAVREGQPILADDVRLSLEIPAWAKFTFPEDAPAAGEA
jgi:folate-binding protein YgfZ